MGNKKVFNYESYQIPTNLVNLTGGGAETWHVISIGHMDQYKKYCPINLDHAVLEIGCGVGRDAIQLTKHLSKNGSYVGIDIIEPSIKWCQENITPRFPNFKFLFFDIQSQIHNSLGKIETTDIKLPTGNDSIDRVILQSVFTHMFEVDIVHYLKEFNRVLRPGGKVFASFFIFDDKTLHLAQKNKFKSHKVTLTFEYPHGDGCRINDENYPEGAVAYTREVLDRMLQKSSLALDQPIHLGHWCGREGTPDGQDIVIMKKSI